MALRLLILKERHPPHVLDELIGIGRDELDPAEKMRGVKNREGIFSAAGVLSATPFTCALRRDDGDFAVFCFSKRRLLPSASVENGCPRQDNVLYLSEAELHGHALWPASTVSWKNDSCRRSGRASM